ncbi:hypothetical protein PoB_000064700 [Plakobranchus ocellatus]|uniref:Ig-like domain-containing protein n=1 Tax=Plakobranchus ocellatus TaxID=259542 RepID=A0AAV3XVK0_9GAST|nr:hypothetical protein PoB_000064700 [Plakobranchus ocellatus]
MIQGQETEISCTGTVDDMGDVILTSQDSISDTFVESTHFSKTSTRINSSDQCKSSLTTQFTSALDLSHNGTKLRCETSSPVSTSRTIEIVIVPESICDGKNEGTAVAHPYSLTKYVICGNPMIVQECAASLVWRQDLRTCVDPGAAEVTMLSSTANEGASLEVTCSLSPGSFTSIGVFRRVGDIEQPIVYFFSNGTESIISQGVTSTIRRLVSSATHMVSVFDQVTCTVAGEYVCKHDNGQQASANITVHVPASVVEIITSEDMIEGQETEISCTGTVDNMGDVILTSQDTISDTFVESTHFSKTSTRINSGDQCKSSLTTQFTSELDLSHNGTKLRCETSSPVSTSRTIEIVIVPESICDGKNEDTAVAHPYSLIKYVICGKPIKVHTCAISLIWRHDLKTCVDPGAAGN